MIRLSQKPLKTKSPRELNTLAGFVLNPAVTYSPAQHYRLREA